MSRAYSDIAFTSALRAMQTRMGSRAVYASLDHTNDRHPGAMQQANSAPAAAPLQKGSR